jgi:hypothetical protein
VCPSLAQYTLGRRVYRCLHSRRKLGQMEVSSSFRAATASGNQFANAISEREANDQSRQSEDLALSLRFDEDIATNFA